MKDVLFEGVSWSVAAVLKSGLNQVEFVAQGLKERHYEQYSQTDRIALLKEAYRQIIMEAGGEPASLTKKNDRRGNATKSKGA